MLGLFINTSTSCRKLVNGNRHIPGKAEMENYRYERRLGGLRHLLGPVSCAANLPTNDLDAFDLSIDDLGTRYSLDAAVL